MCPVCLTATAFITATIASAGGATCFLMKKRGKKKMPDNCQETNTRKK